MKIKPVKVLKGNIDVKVVLLTIWIVSIAFVYTAKSIMEYYGGISSRQYGVVFSASVPKCIALLMVFLLLIQGKVKLTLVEYKDDFLIFLVILVFRFFIPINTNWHSSLIGVLNIITYILVYLILKSFVNYEQMKKSLYYGFAILSVLELTVGLLYYAGIVIPYVTTTSTTTARNGIMRMQGTFLHPAEFSLMMGFLAIFFACMFFFEKKKSALIFLAVSYIAIYLSFARTALVFISALLCMLLWIHYRKKFFARILMICIVLFAVVQVVNSEYFVALFVDLSIEDMFQARFLHWIIGWRIMTQNPINFLVGIGVNNNVDFIKENYSILTRGLSSSAILTSEFAVNNPIHNSYLIVGCECGIFYMLFYIKLIIGKIVKAYNWFKNTTTDKGYLLFISCSMLWYGVYAMQGWGALKECAMVFLFLFCALYKKIEGSINC